MAEATVSVPAFIDRVVEFPGGVSYELLRPLTTYRHCQDGTPAEARIVFTCRQIASRDGPLTATTGAASEGFVMKIKVRFQKSCPPKRNPSSLQ